MKHILCIHFFFLHIKMKNKLNKLNFDTNDLFYKEAS